jgi:hypothetical protein
MTILNPAQLNRSITKRLAPERSNNNNGNRGKLFLSPKLHAIALLFMAVALGTFGAQLAHAAGPTFIGTLSISGTPQDGQTLTVTGGDPTNWKVQPCGASCSVAFTVSYAWQRLSGGTWIKAANTTSRNYTTNYTIWSGDVRSPLRVQVRGTDYRSDGSYQIGTVYSQQTGTVQAYPTSAGPQLEFTNGFPESSTASTHEIFQIALHSNAGTPTCQYQIDTSLWTSCKTRPAKYIADTGQLSVGSHTIAIRGSNSNGTSAPISFTWNVVAMPAAIGCQGSSCWHPPHLDSTGLPMRWDWQIQVDATHPLTQRTGAAAVDMYDIDGFNTTAATVNTIKSSWVANTYAHPRVTCYLDLGSWEDFRPDAQAWTFGPGSIPQLLGNVLSGYPHERWIDVRGVSAMNTLVQNRIQQQCAGKGFDTVEIDNIDAWDPVTTSGFMLTMEDAEAWLADLANRIHSLGMTVLWKNEPYLTYWAASRFDGALNEQCYEYMECTAAQDAGSSSNPACNTADKKCGYDDFIAAGMFVAHVEYGYVNTPTGGGTGRHVFASFCHGGGPSPIIDGVYDASSGFGHPYTYSGLRMDVNLYGGQVEYPCWLY